VAALHDLNHAAMFCDRVAILHRGEMIAVGPPREVLTAATIADVFGVKCAVTRAEGGFSHIRFLPAHGRADPARKVLAR
jgi:iron complex transport system ATP-binding protein